MLLIKLRAPPGNSRTEVLQLAEIFRARVADVSDETLTLVVSGDPGKVSATTFILSSYVCVRVTAIRQDVLA